MFSKGGNLLHFLHMEQSLKFHTLIPLILTLSLLGCQTPPADMTPPAPTAEHTPVPTAAPTLTLTPTEVPLEALPVEVLVQKYLAGEIDDVSGLNLEQHAAFSAALAEKINSTAKEITYKKGEAYLDPITLTMRTYGDTTPEQRIFKPAYQIKENLDGSYSYTDQWGEEHVIVGFDKNDQHHVVKDASTNLINFPQVGIMTSGERVGMPFSQAWLAESYSTSIPEHKRDGFYVNDIVFLRQIKGEAYFDLRGRPTPRTILEFGKIIRDSSGKPILLYKFMATQEGSATLFYQEGTSSKMGVNFTTSQEYMSNIPANHMAWFGTYGTELSSVFYYAPVNAENWADLELHTEEAIKFLKDGKIPKSKIPLVQAKIVIFVADQR
jgi:hypothetical protein